MKQNLLTIIALAGAIAAGASKAHAAGFQVSLQGQKQIGMGHTGTGLTFDASSMFFNPGATSFLRGNNVMLGASLIFNRVGYVAPGSYRQENTQSPVGTPFMGYAAFKLADDRLALGLAVYTPYGSSVQWGSDFSGANILESLSLRAIFIQPTASYRVSKHVGIGAGFVYATGGVDLRRRIDLYSNGEFGRAELSGNAQGFGYNVGVLWQPTEEINLGVSYRSRVDMRVSGGTANFTASSIAASRLPTGTMFDATLPLPAVANIGIAYMGIPRLTIAADANYTFWSAYRELRFDYSQPVNFESSAVSPRNYEDAIALRLGFNYAASDVIALRAGAYWDQTPVQPGYMTPETPDANRIGMSLGLGVRPVEALEIDASLLFLNGARREQTLEQIGQAGTTGAVLPGTYQLRGIIPGLQIGYRF